MIGCATTCFSDFCNWLWSLYLCFYCTCRGLAYSYHRIIVCWSGGLGMLFQLRLCIFFLAFFHSDSVIACITIMFSKSLEDLICRSRFVLWLGGAFFAGAVGWWIATFVIVVFFVLWLFFCIMLMCALITLGIFLLAVCFGVMTGSRYAWFFRCLFFIQ